MKTFGERLREQREFNEYTQAMLAARCGLPASAISHFESDRRSPALDSLRKIVAALDTSANYLLGLEQTVHNEDYEQGYADALEDAQQALALLMVRHDNGNPPPQNLAREGALRRATPDSEFPSGEKRS